MLTSFFTLGLLVKLATTTSYIPVPIPNDTSEERMLRIALYDLSEAYKLDYKTMESVVSCESQWNPNALNPHDPTKDGSDSVWSTGLLQFKDGLFAATGKKLGIENLDIHNGFQQLEAFAYLWSIGQEKRWANCVNKARNLI